MLTMNERMRESLSALLDGEADELEIRRVLSQVDDDQELRQTWRRYNLARDVMDGQRETCHAVDISARVMARIEQEQADSPVTGLGRKLLRPVASFAVAASVAATVVIGGQQIASLGGAGQASGGDPAVAASASPVGLVNSLGATTVTRTAYRELARQRMERYMQEHAEQAALNTPQGLIPFARVPEIRE
jgi:sigma-E factor negative regulatory protein RseA